MAVVPGRTSERLRAAFGDVDIYLFDQLLKGRFDRRRRVLDAGCGDGRNLVYLRQQGFECVGVDREPGTIARARRDPSLPTTRAGWILAELDALPFGPHSFDAVICSAVLHFARDGTHFIGMVREVWRVLRPDGLLLARLASNIGLEAAIGPGGRRTRLPDGSDRFVVDEAMLLTLTDDLNATLCDPIKTTVVSGQRCMTTWCLEKRA
ncbi:MAG: class I SAM-dependent methyltransferase [Vicinamibacterales bacterium]